MSKPCRYCGLDGHSTINCYAKPKTKISRNHDSKWIRFRTDWIKDHPAPWYCHYCGGYLSNYKELTLDHKIPKSGLGIKYKYDESNIVPCCFKCNYDKGSISYDKYIEKLRSRREKA